MIVLSVRLGCAAIFLIGGLARDEEPMPILLRSGDVVIMSGPACRRAYHGTTSPLSENLETRSLKFHMQRRSKDIGRHDASAS